MYRSCRHVFRGDDPPSGVLRIQEGGGVIFIPRNLLTRMAYNICSMRSFFKRQNAFEGSRSQLSNAFFRLKNDLL